MIAFPSIAVYACFSVTHTHTNVYQLSPEPISTVESSMERRRKRICEASLAVTCCILIISIVGAGLSLIQTTKTISNAGAVKGVGVGVYWNSTCTNQTSSIAWGILDPGSNKTVTVYVRNEGNVAATLSKTTLNWAPSSAASYLTLTWNYANQTLGVNKVLQINLTLAVSLTVSAIIGFSFDIVITATG
jgi:hypothetical protein